MVKVVWLCDYFMTVKLQTCLLHRLASIVNVDNAFILLNEAIKRYRKSTIKAVVMPSDDAWSMIREKTSMFIVFCMRDWLTDAVKLDRLIDKSGYQTFVNCASFIIDHPTLGKYACGLFCPIKASTAIAKKSTVSHAYNIIRQNESMIMDKCYNQSTDIRMTFNSKSLIDRRRLTSLPFIIGRHLWTLSASLTDDDQSSFKLSISYFSSTSLASIGMNRLSSVYTLDDRSSIVDQSSIDTHMVDVISFDDMMIDKSSIDNRLIDDIDVSYAVRIVKSCDVPSIVVVKACSLMSTDGLVDAAAVVVDSRPISMLTVDDECVTIADGVVRGDTVSIAIRLVHSAYMSHALTQTIRSIVMACRRPKTVDISDIDVNNEKDLSVILRLFMHMNRNHDQDAALLFADYGRHDVNQPRNMMLP